ncbi:uncharacterized protein FOMMEDRAFT_138485 [Fomitiporia mediterranea MF3/22]|uniref:uncharacterized protein n=1 Tax=Fomitiporia mediterranea (strain MF3/22) TaxID=694068 RepID=UPI0004408954|nr:uncharacterized protein FOMMEDRAFT_138485 [Fomitiporia mediterranea MF3/22]EJD06574.1 hypothetical protein FOMMEDRAFT_138485 [Fomitiporia mediterranea MF3/22]
MPPHTDRLEDEETSSLSDYDSEWTQVSGTEDDSDFPPLTAISDRPSSRADTIDGSVDGDLWEGFIDGISRQPSQSSEETRPLDVDATDATPEDAEALNASVAPRASEDEIVNDALDSSLVGTLRASRIRSRASSLHTSLTESQSKLRLSFPDPLSSREDLDSDHATQDASAPPSSVEEHCENAITEDTSSSFADIEPPAVLSVSEMADETMTPAAPASAISDSAQCVLYLYLYGSATSSKWNAAEKIMILFLQRDNDTPSYVEEDSTRHYYFRYFRFGDPSGAVDKQEYSVRVIDRTSESSEMESTSVPDDIPTLALILLPARLSAVLPRHSFYLPLISHSSLDFGSEAPIASPAFSEQVTIDSARYTLKRLDLPKEDIITLDAKCPKAIMDVSALDRLDRASLAQAFSIVFSRAGVREESRKGYEGVRLFGNIWYTLAFVAASLLAITIGGFQVHRSSVPSPTFICIKSRPTASDSATSVKFTSTLSTSLIPSEDVTGASRPMHTPLATIITEASVRNALASIDRKTDVLKLTDIVRGVISVKTESSVPSTSIPEPSSGRTKAQSWANKLNLGIGEYIPRDLIVWPVNVIGKGSKESTSSQIHAGKVTERCPSGNCIKSLSLRAVHNSLAVVSSTRKALKKAAGRDMTVVYEAIDELLNALGRQINSAKAEMKDAKSVALSSFSFRNMRAKENAKRLRQAGEHFIKAAGERLRNKGEEVMNMASQVRESAKAIRQDAINSRQSRRMRRKERQRLRNDRSGAKDGNWKGRQGRAQKKHDRGLRRQQRRQQHSSE